MAENSPADWQEKILHITLTVGHHRLTGCDLLPADYQAPQGMWVMFPPVDVAAAERIFKALSENGTVQVPLAQSFWALRFGMLVDQFGIPWMINCEQPSANS